MTRTILPITVSMALGFFALPSAAEAQQWYDRIAFNGDFRVRYENIDEDFESGRDRMRFRARFGLNATVTDDIKVVMQLATGGDNPTSSNQTFDDGFSRKDIRLDMAYVDWRVSEVLKVNFGKMKNPLFKAGSAQVAWDSDLTPEGVAAIVTAERLFATAAVFSVEERSSADDSLVFAVQAGIKLPVGEDSKLTAGLGYFGYTNTIGNTPFYNGSANGNSVDINGNYIYDYKNSEVFAQFDTRAAGWPLSVFAHFVRNNEVSIEDTGYAFGAKLGSAKQKGDMEFGWTYQDIEADAVIGTFSDSDFGGGGTDASGHILKAKYGLSGKIFLAGSLFMNEVDRFQGVEHDYTRLQLDVEFKFK